VTCVLSSRVPAAGRTTWCAPAREMRDTSSRSRLGMSDLHFILRRLAYSFIQSNSQVRLNNQSSQSDYQISTGVSKNKKNSWAELQQRFLLTENVNNDTQSKFNSTAQTECPRRLKKCSLKNSVKITSLDKWSPDQLTFLG
jgi:hypothetical protein